MMNQPFQSDPAQNQMDQSQAQPSAAPQVPPQASPPLSSPFEPITQTPPPLQSSPNPISPPSSSPMPNQMDPLGQPSSSQPMGMEPETTGPKSSFWLIVILVVILFVGALIFASWEGWINLGSISKLWKKSTPTATTPAVTDTASADDKVRKSDLANLKAALKSYYQANQTYPVATTMQKTTDPASALAVLLPTYIAALPDDPLSPTYYYGYTSDGKTFTLSAVLEKTDDPSGTSTGSVNIYKITDGSVETPVTADTSGTSTGTTSDSPVTTSTSTSTDTSTDAGSSSTGSTSASSSATAGQ